MPHATVHDVFAATARRTPQAEFLFTESVTAKAYGIPAGAMRWGEAAAAVERLRAAYAGAGYGHGHRVGLLLENRPAFFLHWLALNRLGASVVPINPELRSAELQYLLDHSGMCLAVTLPERRAGLRAAAREAGIDLEVAGPGDASVPPARGAAPLDGSPDAGTECGLLYTSGTTGRPKGCVLPNEYYLAAGAWYNAIGGLCAVRPGSERLITPLPMSHMNAMAYSTMAMIMSGGCIIALDRFHPATWWSDVRESEATIVHYLG